MLRKQLFDPNHLYGMSRHFVWLIPVTNLCIFLALGLLGCIVDLAWPRRGRWLFVRLLCALTLLPIALGRLSPDLHVWPGWSWRWGWRRGSFRCCERNARAFPPVRPGQFPGGPRDGGDPGGVTLGCATGSSNRAQVRAPCRRRGRPMSS